MSVPDLNSTPIGFIFVSTAIALAVWQIIQYRVNKTVEDRLEQLENKVLEQLSELTELMQNIDRRTDRVEYALYNEGKTGLINKVDSLMENQQAIRTDVEVLKARRKRQ